MPKKKEASESGIKKMYQHKIQTPCLFEVCKVKPVTDKKMRTFLLHNNISQTDIWRAKFEKGFVGVDLPGDFKDQSIEGVLIVE